MLWHSHLPCILHLRLKYLARFGWLYWQNVKRLILLIILSCTVFTLSLGKRIRRIMCIWIINTWPILFIPYHLQFSIGNRSLVSIQLCVVLPHPDVLNSSSPYFSIHTLAGFETYYFKTDIRTTIMFNKLQQIRQSLVRQCC